MTVDVQKWKQRYELLRAAPEDEQNNQAKLAEVFDNMDMMQKELETLRTSHQ